MCCTSNLNSQIMMNQTQYQNQIKKLSTWKAEIFRIMEFQLETKNRQPLIDTINYRLSNLNENDINIASGYLSLGIFRHYDDRFRTACICVCMEAEYQRDLNNEIARCSQYEGNEPIFDNPTIKEGRINDLIDYRIFKREPLSNIFKIGESWGYFDRRIPAQVYEWVENCFADKPCRVRVEPDSLYTQRPPQTLIECMIIPPQFQWWKNLSIYKGHTKGSVYQLLGNDCKNNYRDYYDYNILHIRRLDVSETRNDDNYISMMIEELEEDTCILDPQKKYVIGRMIHLDSNAAVGISYKDANLSHIDLAYNLYLDDSASERMGQFLCNGKTVNASHRTHILRLENIPFSSIFKIAYSFFKSKTLTTEWFSNEFVD